MSRCCYMFVSYTLPRAFACRVRIALVPRTHVPAARCGPRARCFDRDNGHTMSTPHAVPAQTCYTAGSSVMWSLLVPRTNVPAARCGPRARCFDRDNGHIMSTPRAVPAQTCYTAGSSVMCSASTPWPLPPCCHHVNLYVCAYK